ncbi:MAG TPA: hypothetical protein VHB93_00160 [Candidatus Paceibacterota bacterium]|nr:hypothetical protein [Candidatus Paceibacterota bacterium]
MTKLPILALILAMVITIVIVDVLFFRNQLVARFIANVGIVLVFIALYLAYFK